MQKTLIEFSTRSMPSLMSMWIKCCASALVSRDKRLRYVLLDDNPDCCRRIAHSHWKETISDTMTKLLWRHVGSLRWKMA